MDGYSAIGVSMNRGESISVGDKLQLGPFDDASRIVRVRSIHNGLRESVQSLKKGECGCLCIREQTRRPGDTAMKLKREITYGKVCVDSSASFPAANTVAVRLEIGMKSIIVKNGYKPTLHCGNVSPPITISNIRSAKMRSPHVLRCNERGTDLVTLAHPQVLYPGQRFLIRDGKPMGGVGLVTEVITAHSD